MRDPHRNTRRRAFTLIEISIVLIIIALIVGGVLVGQDLIKGAAVRAQIAQIEKFNSATNAFKNKYGDLPGDIPDPHASMFGFQARGQYAGEGDGNGKIEGVTSDAAGQNFGVRECAGETVMFWVDLSAANLIEGSFTTASTHTPNASNVTLTSNPNIGAYFPAAKIGGGNYVYAWSQGAQDSAYIKNSTFNYFGISGGSNIEIATCDFLSSPVLAVAQAFAIDKKIDDGLPQTGNVVALFLDWNWQGSGFTGNWVGAADTSATQGLSTTCYDNGNVTGATQQYSMEENSGSGQNCALSFQMQGAAR